MSKIVLLVTLLFLILDFGFIYTIANYVKIRRRNLWALFTWVFFTLIVFGLFGYAKKSSNEEYIQYRNYFFITTFILIVYVPKAFMALFYAINWVLSKLIKRKFQYVSLIGMVLGGLFFVLAIYGVCYWKRDFVVKEVTITSNKIPVSFDGFRIAQISDMHLGSYVDTSIVAEGLRILQAQKPDAFIFTGDLINSSYKEVTPYRDLFKQLTMQYGKYAILGNHDMADYRKWYDKYNSKQVEKLIAVEREIGFNVLENNSVYMKKGNDSIALAGVLNWGLPPFRKYGEINKALHGIPKSVFTILASHDPSHWRAEVLSDNRADLMLAGHTHGMQMGVNTKWIKWSLSKYKYPEWSGLYQDKSKYLYVNQGFGVIGFFARIGIRPEITIFTLKHI